MAVSRSGEIGVIDEHGRERERYKIPYGAVISVEDGDACVKLVRLLQPGIRILIRLLPKWPVRCSFSDLLRCHVSTERSDEITGLSSSGH